MSFDAAETRRRLVTFLRSYAADAGATGYVVGMSGGLDSAVAGALAAEAVGADNVLAIRLPHATSASTDADHATLAAEAFDIPQETLDITAIVDAAQTACAHHVPNEAAALNLRPRARMMLLYAHAQTLKRLVLGTSNKSEFLTGYFTKWGDGAADVYPLGDLYKTQVRALAHELGVPAIIINKPPSAGLATGQTDEADLGLSYADLDRLLVEFEGGHDIATAARRANVAQDTARAIDARLRHAAHKRFPLVIPKVGFRTPGWDWREARHLGGDA